MVSIPPGLWISHWWDRVATKVASWERMPEPHTHKCGWVEEPWNTASNLPFILFGLFGGYPFWTSAWDPSTYPESLEIYRSSMRQAYAWMVAIGIGSAIHHATTPKWTILVDWTPILGFIFFSWVHSFLDYLTPELCVYMGFAVYLLWSDHIYRIMPAPWGHVTWHISAAYAMVCLLQAIWAAMLLESLHAYYHVASSSGEWHTLSGQFASEELLKYGRMPGMETNALAKANEYIRKLYSL